MKSEWKFDGCGTLLGENWVLEENWPCLQCCSKRVVKCYFVEQGHIEGEFVVGVLACLPEPTHLNFRKVKEKIWNISNHIILLLEVIFIKHLKLKGIVKW